MRKIPFFLDSGAHGLYEKFVHKAKGLTAATKWSYYDSKAFWKYVDEYGKFCKAHEHEIDVFVNVDVIFNPELTWKIQCYLEKTFKLKPLPVVHFGTPMKWLHKYMDNHEYIGIGGLGQEVSYESYVHFADRVFETICDAKSKLPRWKTHGFAVTSFKLMARYPWYSVDSTSYLQFGAYGAILMPRLRAGKIPNFSTPHKIFVSNDTNVTRRVNRIAHFKDLTPTVEGMYRDYIKQQGFDLELMRTNWEERERWNMFYFATFAETLPKWPWPFKLANDVTTKGLLS